MTTTPQNASSNLTGKPPVVDLATWQAAREELLIREKAHTREGDAIAAARRRLPMVELDGAVEVAPTSGPGSSSKCLAEPGSPDWSRTSPPGVGSQTTLTFESQDPLDGDGVTP